MLVESLKNVDCEPTDILYFWDLIMFQVKKEAFLFLKLHPKALPVS